MYIVYVDSACYGLDLDSQTMPTFPEHHSRTHSSHTARTYSSGTERGERVVGVHHARTDTHQSTCTLRAPCHHASPQPLP